MHTHSTPAADDGTASAPANGAPALHMPSSGSATTTPDRIPREKNDMTTSLVNNMFVIFILILLLGRLLHSQLQNPRQLRHGVLVIVHTEVEVAIVQSERVAFVANHQQRRRLLAALVAARLVAGV